MAYKLVKWDVSVKLHNKIIWRNISSNTIKYPCYGSIMTILSNQAELLDEKDFNNMYVKFYFGDGYSNSIFKAIKILKKYFFPEIYKNFGITAKIYKKDKYIFYKIPKKNKDGIVNKVSPIFHYLADNTRMTWQFENNLKAINNVYKILKKEENKPSIISFDIISQIVILNSKKLGCILDYNHMFCPVDNQHLLKDKYVFMFKTFHDSYYSSGTRYLTDNYSFKSYLLNNKRIETDENLLNDYIELFSKLNVKELFINFKIISNVKSSM